MDETNTLKWVASGLGAILTLIIGSKLGESLAARRFARQDSGDAIHRTNHAHQIDANVTASQRIYTRVEKLEAVLFDVQEKLAAQMASNAGLQVENKALTKENLRQEQEIHALRDANCRQTQEIAVLRNTLSETQHQLETLRQTVEQMRQRT